MGYSVSTPAMSQKAKGRMLAFMEEHFRPAHMIFENLEDTFDRTASGILTEEHLAYDKGTSKMGFNYSAGELPRYYAFCVCRWMALKVGRKRRFKKHGIPDVSVPYIVYDGYEACPVLPKTQWEGVLEPERIDWCDELGVKPMASYLIIKHGLEDPDNPILSDENYWANRLTEMEASASLVREELRRLDELWKTSHE